TLDVIRVYTKPPKEQPDYERPYVLQKGATVRDVAEKIHKSFPKLFRYARIWGPSSDFPGQKVGIEHELQDTDVVEVTINRR
ncbi:MAG: TGS domain-containing protein, partial [Candidatus Heimdallarchaeaceae archaeon]